MTINGNLVAEYSDFVSNVFLAFLPLITSVISIFIVFALLNMLRHFILKIK